MKSAVTYFAYIRKSSEREDAQTLSIDAQKRELQEFADKQKIKVKEFFVETKSAYKAGRPQFNEMLKRIEAGEANGILTYHLSRIARNSRDGGNVIYMMGEGKINHILTPTGGYAGDNSDDLLVMQIHFAMAKKSSDDTSKFVKRDITSKLLKGEYPAFAPLGYLNLDQYGRIAGKRFSNEKQELLAQALEREGRKFRRLEPDPLIAPIIQKLYELCETGRYSLNQLRREAFKLGLRGERSGQMISKQSLQRLLTSPIFYGGLPWKCMVYEPDQLPEEYRHVAIVTKSTHDRVQEVLHNKSKPRMQKHVFAYTGLMHCGECGSMITAEIKKGYTYYRCTKKKLDYKCSQKYLREDALEKQFRENLNQYVIPQDFIDWSLGVLRSSHDKEAVQQTTILGQLRKQLSQKEAELNQLLKFKISTANVTGELLTDEEYIQQKKFIQTEKSVIVEKINDLEQHADDWLEQCESFFEFASKCAKKWEVGSVEQKRMVFNTVFGSNGILQDKKVMFTAQKPFFQTASLQKSSSWRE